MYHCVDGAWTSCDNLWGKARNEKKKCNQEGEWAVRPSRNTECLFEFKSKQPWAYRVELAFLGEFVMPAAFK